jgi:hypothetical protein
MTSELYREFGTQLHGIVECQSYAEVGMAIHHISGQPWTVIPEAAVR